MSYNFHLNFSRWKRYKEWTSSTSWNLPGSRERSYALIPYDVTSEWTRLMLLQFLDERENIKSEVQRERWKLSICCAWMTFLVGNRSQVWVYFFYSRFAFTCSDIEKQRRKNVTSVVIEIMNYRWTANLLFITAHEEGSMYCHRWSDW